MPKFNNKTDTPEQLFKRYLKARNRMNLQRNRLEDAYDYTLPNRVNFEEEEPGSPRNIQIFDDTAPHGLIQYANDVQSILTPPYQRWAKLVPGVDVPEARKKQFEITLEEVTDVLFRHFEQSNFYQVAAEAILDMGISTGIMVFEEGTEDDPFIFRSIPINEVAFEEGRNGALQNFWRKFKLSLRQITLKWPDIKLPSNLQDQLKNDPDEKVELIEGLVLVPGKTVEGDEFQYYIQDMSTQKLLLEEKREWSPWVGFRAAKTTGEVIGYGPILRVLPTIRGLNQMQEWDLRSFKFSALGVMLVENSGVLNPFNVTIEPGSLVPIESSVSGKDPIRPLQGGGDARITLEKIQARQAVINQALFSQPLPAETKSGVSATEIAIRQQNWVRQNSAAFGRLSVEFIEPIIKIGINILAKKKLIPITNLKVDNKNVQIKYESPLIAIQDQQDVQKVQQGVEFIASSFGAQGLSIAYDLPKVNVFVNRKLGVPAELVKSEEEMAKQLQGIQQQQIAEQAAQQAAQLPPGQVEQPELPLAQ